MNKKKLKLKLTNPFVRKQSIWMRLWQNPWQRLALIVGLTLLLLSICGFLVRPLFVSLTFYDPLVLFKELEDQKVSVQLVDLRPKTNFQKAHIRGALNLPWKGDQANWLSEFKKIESLEKKVVLYEYSQSSVAPRELSLSLAKRGVAASALSIGWNEWRHFQTNWLPENEWGTFDLERLVEPRP